jgi:hypothetical protein
VGRKRLDMSERDRKRRKPSLRKRKKVLNEVPQSRYFLTGIRTDNGERIYTEGKRLTTLATGIGFVRSLTK